MRIAVVLWMCALLSVSCGCIDAVCRSIDQLRSGRAKLINRSVGTLCRFFSTVAGNESMSLDPVGDTSTDYGAGAGPRRGGGDVKLSNHTLRCPSTEPHLLAPADGQALSSQQ